METEPEKPVELRTTHIEDMALEDELVESHYSRPHWARATTETPMKIRDIQEPAGGGIGGPRFGNQFDVHGLLQKGEMADQHQARVEDTSSDVSHRRTVWGLPKCTSKDRRCRD